MKNWWNDCTLCIVFICFVYVFFLQLIQYEYNLFGKYQFERLNNRLDKIQQTIWLGLARYTDPVIWIQLINVEMYYTDLYLICYGCFKVLTLRINSISTSPKEQNVVLVMLSVNAFKTNVITCVFNLESKFSSTILLCPTLYHI